MLAATTTAAAAADTADTSDDAASTSADPANAASVFALRTGSSGAADGRRPR